MGGDRVMKTLVRIYNDDGFPVFEQLKPPKTPASLWWYVPGAMIAYVVVYVIARISEGR